MKPQDTSPTRIAAAPPVLNPTLRESKPAEIAIAFPDNAAASVVFGHYDQNIARIERSLGVSAYANGNQVVIKGPREASEQARRVFEMLYERVKLGQSASEGDVEGVIAESAYQGLLFPGDEASKESFGVVKTRKRGVVRARSAAQDQYLMALRKYEPVFAEGPAGTGKTWLAVGHAVSLLEQGLVERLVLSRPAVEAGERLGFLPGDMRDKVDPDPRPVYDALYDFMDGRMVERGLQTGMIEIAPLAFMRGRTLSKAAILLDEAQNATAMQMKMFLTRLGEGSRMMVNGDPSQTDLAPGQKSGLDDAIRLLASFRASATSASPMSTSCATISCARSSRLTDAAVGRDSRPQENERFARHHRCVEPVARIAEGAGLGARDDRRLRRGEPNGRARRRRGEPLPRGRRFVAHAQLALARHGQADQRALVSGSRSPAPPRAIAAKPGRDGGGQLGDIALAFETLAREADELGVPLADHYRHLVVHGFLHLIGYDHETDEEAERMEALETRILARLGAANPYAREVVEE